MDFIDRRIVRKAETENNMQISYFKVTFLIEVKAEGISSLCHPKLACVRIWLLPLSLYPDFWEGQIKQLGFSLMA